MANQKDSESQVSLFRRVILTDAHDGENISGLVMLMYGWDATNRVWRRVLVDETGQLQGVGGGTTSYVYDTAVYDTATYV